MSVSLNPNHLEFEDHERGLTLLEVLTVLFIIGVVTGLAVPNFPVLLDRVINANQRDTVIQAINAIPFSALEGGQDYILRDDAEGQDDPGVLFATAGQDASLLLRALDPKDAQLPIPQGWKIVVPQPIIYKASGYCSGGTLELHTGTTVTPYVLTAPLCQIHQ